MPIETQTPNSPGWWFERLIKKLGERQDRYNRLESYYRGTNEIPVTADRAVRKSYQRLMSISGTNFGELVVEAVRERMQPLGFRTGAPDDANGDAEAWRIWQANSLDADNALVSRAQLSMGMGYVIVGPPDPEIGAPLITAEDPRQVIAEMDPARRRKVLAALKVFRDDVFEVDRAYLYLPGVVIMAERVNENVPSGDSFTSPTVRMDSGGFEFKTVTTLPFNQVPVVPFPNSADAFGSTQSELEPHLPILDRINYTILNRVEIATLQAFRQRAIKGVPDKDEQGNEVDYDDVFAADPGAFWVLPATADMWESGVVDLTPIISSVKADVQNLAAVTRTPLFYLTPDATNGSAEGASLAREGLVFKTEDRLLPAGESWEQVMSLAFRFDGDLERANRAGLETIWRSPERFSLAERYDAASKAQAAGVPWRTVMEDVLQFSPQKIDQMATERAADALLAPPPIAPPVAPAVTGG